MKTIYAEKIEGKLLILIMESSISDSDVIAYRYVILFIIQ